jgi:hypothetical protein
MKNKYIYIVIILVIIGVISFFKISSIRAKGLEIEINKSINGANYCSTDSDCITTQLGQPFGCFNIINKDFDLIDIKNKIETYKKNDYSVPKNYNCTPVPNREELKCENNKCININSGKLL